MTIEHLILCGGGPVGLVQYGALKYLHEKEVWRLEDIKSIYCCSIGCLIAIIISLDLEWEWIDDFIIKRPWINIMDYDKINYLDILTHKGIIDESFWIKCLKPLFLAKNIDIAINLLDFYNITGIDIHFFSTQVNTLEKCNFNHISHPELSVISALYMSSCIPFLFKPQFIGNNCYLDGGICNNAPTKDCIDDYNCLEDEILAFINTSSSHKIDELPILSFITDDKDKDKDKDEDEDEDLKNSNIFSFLIYIVRKLLQKLHELNSINNINIKNTINVKFLKTSIDIKQWFEILYNKDNIKEVIDYGKLKGAHFYDNIYTNKTDDTHNVIIENPC